MITRHLIAYHLLWMNFGTVRFLVNCLVSQNLTTLCRITKRGAKSNQVHNSKTKLLSKRYQNIIHNLVHSCWHLNVSCLHLQTAVLDRASARSLCSCCSKL